MIPASGNGPHVIPLDGTGCDSNDVGGKAAGLDRLASHGFRIPRSHAVTVAAYRAFIAASHLDDWLREVLRRPLPAPDALASATAEVEHAFLTAAIPGDVADAIASVAIPILARGPVAVRSSATAEDLDAASFAGQYRSYISVTDLSQVFDAVRRCWASLWFPAARAYRRRQSVDEQGLAMGVVVQETVDAEWSGVGFTEDPGGDPNTLRIEAIPRMGEALVSGAVTPFDYSVLRDTLEVRGTDPSSQPLPFLEDLARMLILVEERLDAPQDVEWCYARGDLVLLQSRPITLAGPLAACDDGFDRPLGSRDAFTPHGVVEMLPGTVTPLLWTINAPMIEHGYRAVVDALGGSPLAPGRTLLGRFAGRAALNLSALGEIAESVPGGSTAELERQFLGRPITTDGPEAAPRKAGPAAVYRARRTRRALDDELALVRSAVAGILSLRVDPAALPVKRLLAYRRHIRDLAWRVCAVEVAASSAGAAGYRQLELLLTRWLAAGEAATWAQRITAGGLGGETAGSGAGRSVRAVLARVEAQQPALAAALRAADRADLAAVAAASPAGELLTADLCAIARRTGSLAMYGGATGEHDLGWLWDEAWHALQPAAPRRDDPDGAESELRSRLRESKHWGTWRILTGQVVDLRMRWILRQARETTSALAARERAKAALLALGGEERRIIDEAARRLVASRQLAETGDVEQLADTELTAMLLGAAPPPRAEMRRRRAVIARNAAGEPLPSLFVGAPDQEAAAEVPATDTLRGWAASPGVIAANARVVSDLADAGRMQPGEILVAVATDPSWTPVLLLAGGIVLETGGPLSHGAIVARELGIPAVLNVPRVTRIVEDGERIEIDGFAGVARRVEHAEVTV